MPKPKEQYRSTKGGFLTDWLSPNSYYITFSGLLSNPRPPHFTPKSYHNAATWACIRPSSKASKLNQRQLLLLGSADPSPTHPCVQYQFLRPFCLYKPWYTTSQRLLNDTLSMFFSQCLASQTLNCSNHSNCSLSAHPSFIISRIDRGNPHMLQMGKINQSSLHCSPWRSCSAMLQHPESWKHPNKHHTTQLFSFA